jgi:small membrane protein
MIAQSILTLLLIAVALVAFAQLRQIPVIGGLVICIASFGAYVVWVPDHATHMANSVGIGRGADLVLYIWVLISSAVLLLLYLNSRVQLHLITALARRMALAGAEQMENPNKRHQAYEPNDARQISVIGARKSSRHERARHDSSQDKKA